MIAYSFEIRKDIFRQILSKGSFGYFFDAPYQDMQILELKPNADLIELCYQMASEKHPHTINHNQDYVKRSQSEQLLDTFSGIYAETAVHILINKVSRIKDEFIKQFDLERTSWEYPNNISVKEYDLKIVSCLDESRYVDIEVKSSAWTDVRHFYDKCHLYGGHINNISELTAIMDYYFQVLIHKQKDETVSPKTLLNGKVKLYIVAGISAKGLYEKGFVGTHSTKAKMVSDNDRVADFINNHKGQIQNASNLQEIKSVVWQNQKELKQPLYIQIAIKNAQNPNETCRKIRADFLGLNLGVLSERLFDKF